MYYWHKFCIDSCCVLTAIVKKNDSRSNQFKALSEYEYKHTPWSFISNFYNCLQMHFLAVLTVNNWQYLFWIVPEINNVYYTFIKILYDTSEFGYAGLFYYLLTGNIYSYTESQECIDLTFNFLVEDLDPSLNALIYLSIPTYFYLLILYKEFKIFRWNVNINSYMLFCLLIWLTKEAIGDDKS